MNVMANSTASNSSMALSPWFADNATSISATAACASLIAVVCYYCWISSLNRRAERVKIVSWCIDQYLDIKKSLGEDLRRAGQEVEARDQAEIHFRERLWTLQYAQYKFFKEKILDPDIYASWLYVRYEQKRTSDPRKAKYETSAWEQAKEDIADSVFLVLMEDVLKRQFVDAKAILRSFKWHRKIGLTSIDVIQANPAPRN